MHSMYIRDLQNEFAWSKKNFSETTYIYDGIKCCSSGALVIYRDLCYGGYCLDFFFFSPGSGSFY